MSDQSGIGIIILAAGSSSRMGRSKQLLPVSGEPLLLRALQVAISSGVDKIVVVVGDNYKLHNEVIGDLPVSILYHEDWKKGMGSSLKAGLQYLLKIGPDVNAAIVMVCDQPQLTALHLKSLVYNYLIKKNKIIASAYSNTVGVPALFDRTLFPVLLSLEDEQGAKKILSDHPELVYPVAFAGGEIDLDTPADYAAFIKSSRTEGK